MFLKLAIDIDYALESLLDSVHLVGSSSLTGEPQSKHMVIEDSFDLDNPILFSEEYHLLLEVHALDIKVCLHTMFKKV